MQGTEKVIAILDLFLGRAFEWTVEDMQAELGIPRSTLYRYLKRLTDAGYLTALPSLGYALGPKVIALDYQVRRSDPLIRAAEPAMEELAQRFGGIALLCRAYDDTVLCVHQVAATNTFSSNYERGRARPLLRGAASLVILAELPPAQLRRIHSQDPEAFQAAGLGETLDAVRQTLARISARGWAATSGAVKPGVSGVAAAVFDSQLRVIGSLSVTLPRPDLPLQAQARVAEQVGFAAGIVTKALSAKPA